MNAPRLLRNFASIFTDSLYWQTSEWRGFIVYLTTTPRVIGSVLVKEDSPSQQLVYFISKILQGLS